MISMGMASFIQMILRKQVGGNKNKEAYFIQLRHFATLFLTASYFTLVSKCSANYRLELKS